MLVVNNIQGARLYGHKPPQTLYPLNLLKHRHALLCVDDQARLAVRRQLLAGGRGSEAHAWVKRARCIAVLPLACGHDRIRRIRAVVRSVSIGIHIAIHISKQPRPSAKSAMFQHGVLVGRRLEIVDETRDVVLDVDLRPRVEHHGTERALIFIDK